MAANRRLTTIRPADVAVLYRRELAEALRERSVVTSSILIPALLYPCLLAVLLFGYEFLRDAAEDVSASVRVVGLPPEHVELVERIREESGLRLADPGEAADVEIEFVPQGQGTLGSLGFLVVVRSDGSSEGGLAGRLRSARLLGRYREDLLADLAAQRGIDAERWQVLRVEDRNLATGSQMGRFILAVVLPVMFIVMVALGCFYPAIDSIAGERERGTWETTLTLATPRVNILLAKFLHASTFGCLAGLLNVVSMSVALRLFFARLLGPLLETGIIELTVPWSALPGFALAAVVLSTQVSACMMVLAAFARTFREGQAMVAPFYLVILLPTVLLSNLELELTPASGIVPIVGLGLALRESLTGGLDPLSALVAVLASLVTVALLLRSALWVLAHEQILEGTFRGSLFSFLRRRFLARQLPGGLG